MENQENKPEKDKKEVDMEAINEFDQNHFYETDHLDKAHFAEQNRSTDDIGYQEISGTASIAGRLADEEKQHQVELKVPKPHPTPTAADGEKLMDVGRAPDS
jgi:hypothetical protein